MKTKKQIQRRIIEIENKLQLYNFYKNPEWRMACKEALEWVLEK